MKFGKFEIGIDALFIICITVMMVVSIIFGK